MGSRVGTEIIVGDTVFFRYRDRISNIKCFVFEKRCRKYFSANLRWQRENISSSIHVSYGTRIEDFFSKFDQSQRCEHFLKLLRMLYAATFKKYSRLDLGQIYSKKEVLKISSIFLSGRKILTLN